MPPLNDLASVQELLNRDREWSAYAIGDLSPGLVEDCDWYTAEKDASALVMLYRGFSPPILFAMGEPEELRPLFTEVGAERVSLHLQPPALAALAATYPTFTTRAMRRMSLRAGADPGVSTDDVRPLTEADLEALTALYADGHRRNEGPAFFHPAMLAQGSFQGIWEGDTLIAVAGTHLYSPALGVCTIGNVYTRSDRRGRGLAARVTTAVVKQAISHEIRTIVLNVGETNSVAQRVYERLGFAAYCDFVEGEATRVSAEPRR